jgi:cell division protein FtsI/penicillin-binding protein 2
MSQPPSRRKALRLAVPLVILAAAAIAVGVVIVARGDSEARSALDRFLAAWENGDYAEAGASTDAASGTVKRELAANRDGLDGAGLETEVLSLEEDGDEARGEVEMVWAVPVIGEFRYRTAVEVRSADDRWAVHWEPELVHPELSEGQRLGTEREFSERAPIVDRGGRELVKPRPVVDVGIVPARLEDRDAAVAAIAEHTEADPKTLRRALRDAAPTQFVLAITLREEDFEEIRDELDRVPGIEFAAGELPLAPAREFARALLGSVGPITEEQLEELGDPYGVGDEVGQFGLQAVFERQLAGTPTGRVVIRDARGVPVQTLHEVEGERGKPLRTTLDLRTQQAGERALGGRSGKAALVAVEPSSGDLLAVANRPVEDTFDRALEGQYPPGSTFKVVTTAALLESGLELSQTVDCPRRISVGGRTFRNFEGSAQGAVPFRLDFTESCNTAFVSLADRLEGDALRKTGEDFGLGRNYDLPVAAFNGSVPVPRDAAEQAASMIGQGRILASPLAMAGVAATVAGGRWQQPRLISSDPSEIGSELPVETVNRLRSLMRAVITSGTGSALSATNGKVAGKTGTAEYGEGNPPATHAWFLAFRGDVAVAVLVEGGASGGEVAAPVAAKFFEAVDSGVPGGGER